MRFGQVALGFFMVLILTQIGIPIMSIMPPGMPSGASIFPNGINNDNLDSTIVDNTNLQVVIDSDVPVPEHPSGTGKETLIEWWNINYDYRRKITIVEPNIADRNMEPVHVYLTFSANTAREHIIAVAYWDSAAWHEVPSQIWNATTHNSGGIDYYDSCTVCFLINITQNYQEIYYIYYDDTYATPPSYTDYIDAIPANGPITDDSTMPWVYSDVTSTNSTNVDTIYIRSSASQYESAAILLTDMLRGGSDWGGPSCGLIAARYGDIDALDTNNGTGTGTNKQYMLLGEFALDPLGVDPGTGSSITNRANVAPDNPAEAWVAGAGVWILDDGPLFTRIKIVTSDGGYCNSGSPWCNETTDTVNRGTNGGAGFLNYTITYTFYWHGNSTYVNVMLDITANPQWAGAQCHVKNYGDWPHIMTFTCGSGTPSTVDAIQNRKAWYGSKYGLYNESVDGRRRDYPIEPWCVWYDDSGQTGYDGTEDPTLALIANVNPVGWEVLSLAVTGMGDNTMLQQILPEGHQGDFFIMPTGETFSYDYTLYTGAYGTNYSEARTLARSINNPVSLEYGEIEFYRHNILTCITKDVTLANVTNVEINLYNSTNDLVRTGTTYDASVFFVELEDDAYTLVSNYTLVSSYAGSITFTINTTQITLDHSIQRGWDRTIYCHLSRLTVHVVDWYDDSNLPADVQVRLKNATNGNPVYNLNASVPTGVASAYLPPDTYNISIRYLGALRIHNQTTPISVSSSSYTTKTIGIVATDHSAELLLKEPTTLTYVELYPEDVADFVVYYYDIDDDVGINVSATPIPYTAQWTIYNSTHHVLDNGLLSQISGQIGNYSMIFDASSYQLGQIYELRIILDANAPVDYWQVVLTIRIRIIDVRTSVSISSPPPFPINDYGNITIYYLDLDHIGVNWGSNTILGYIANNTGGLRIACNVTTYAIYYSTDVYGHPYYLLEIDTSSPEFDHIGVYLITINVTWQGSPYYGNHYDQQVVIQLRGKETSASSTLPEWTPYGDLITFNITYWDIDSGVGITNSTLNVHINIITSDVPGFDRSYWTCIEIDPVGAKGIYRITIDTSSFPGIGSYLFTINIQWPVDQSPYYQSQQVITTGYVRAVHTSFTWKLPGSLYWGDPLYMYATFRDTDHSIVLSDPSNTTVTLWLSWSDWEVVQIFPNGTYYLRINTTSENVGLANFVIRFARDFFETREQLIQITINPLPLYVEVLSTSPWNSDYNGLVVITVKVTDKYGNRINDSNTVFNWAGHTDVSMAFIGNGVFNATFLANESVGTYIINVKASKVNCQTGIGIATLFIVPVETELVIVTPLIIRVVGESFIISANFTTIDGVPLTNASLYYNWAGGSDLLVHVGGGIFNATLDSIGLDLGQFTVYVTASSPNVVGKIGIVTVILTVVPAELKPQFSVINVNWTESFWVLIYFNDSYHNLPIDGADILYRWGVESDFLQPTGIPGWYNISLSTSSFTVGMYEVSLSADQEGYQFCSTIITINIFKQPTTLSLIQIEAYYEEADVIVPLSGTTWAVPQGDILRLYFQFNDSYGNPIIDASATYYGGGLGDGILEYINGYYTAFINLTEVGTGHYSLNIYFTRQNYVSGQRTDLYVTVILVPTEIIALSSPPSVYAGELFNITVMYYDTFHDLPIVNANLTLTIPGYLGPLTMTNNGDGTYTYTSLSIVIVETYQIQIAARGAAKYSQATLIITLVVSTSPATQLTFFLGLVAALIGFIILGAWLAYSKVLSIPWLVRKMRKMSRTIGRGKTPSLSGRDVNRIATRSDSMVGIAEPAYDGIGIAMTASVIPVVVATKEREAEDDVLWLELEQIPGIGHEQKLELFEEMKRIPPKDRVWFIEDLKRQMTERGPSVPPPPVTEALEIPPGIDPDVMKRLDSITSMSPEEKAAVIEQMKGLPKKEQEEIIQALEDSL